MKSAIEQLISDNSDFMENIPESEKYDSLLEESDKIYEELKAMLNPEQIKLLDKFISCNLNIEIESSERHLIHGFKTGLKLIIECL